MQCGVLLALPSSGAIPSNTSLVFGLPGFCGRTWEWENPNDHRASSVNPQLLFLSRLCLSSQDTFNDVVTVFWFRFVFRAVPPGELSVEEAQDPFLVSIHIIADPGESQPLQEAIDKVLAWIHPDLQLFRVSERRASRRRRKPWKVAQPALAVVLFLQEEFGEEQILRLHRTLQRPPWRHHHTERVPGRFLPYLPCSQDFFTLAPGTPLWAIRPVHYGKEIVRFTIYCRHDNYADILKFYELILRRSPSQRKTDFCIFPIFSNLDVDIQFSLKRLPCDQTPVPTDSSVLEFRVKDIGELVPLLPNPCSPISEGRWQTEDLDGNKILLQVPGGGGQSVCLCLPPCPLEGTEKQVGWLCQKPQLPQYLVKSNELRKRRDQWPPVWLLDKVKVSLRCLNRRGGIEGSLYWLFSLGCLGCVHQQAAASSSARLFACCLSLR